MPLMRSGKPSNIRHNRFYFWRLTGFDDMNVMQFYSVWMDRRGVGTTALYIDKPKRWDRRFRVGRFKRRAWYTYSFGWYILKEYRKARWRLNYKKKRSQFNG